MRVIDGSKIVMVERKVMMPSPTGQMAEGFEVQVNETTERWSDIKLEDGTELRVKTTVLSAVRFPGQWDNEGHPMYMLKTAPVVALVSSPEKLRRKAQ
jgi:hypothetical protein